MSTLRPCVGIGWERQHKIVDHVPSSPSLHKQSQSTGPSSYLDTKYWASSLMSLHLRSLFFERLSVSRLVGTIQMNQPIMYHCIQHAINVVGIVQVALKVWYFSLGAIRQNIIAQALSLLRSLFVPMTIEVAAGPRRCTCSPCFLVNHDIISWGDSSNGTMKMSTAAFSALSTRFKWWQNMVLPDLGKPRNVTLARMGSLVSDCVATVGAVVGAVAWQTLLCLNASISSTVQQWGTNCS